MPVLRNKKFPNILIFRCDNKNCGNKLSGAFIMIGSLNENPERVRCYCNDKCKANKR